MTLTRKSSSGKIHAGGIKDGEQVIELLVKIPAPQNYFTKLARRFVLEHPSLWSLA
jgi:hypothetical protein